MKFKVRKDNDPSVFAITRTKLAANKFLNRKDNRDFREWDIRIRRKKYQRLKGAVLHLSIIPFDTSKVESSKFPTLNLAGDLFENDLVVIKIFEERSKSKSKRDLDLGQANAANNSLEEENYGSDDQSSATSMTEKRETTFLRGIEFHGNSTRHILDRSRRGNMKKSSYYKNDKVYDIKHYMRLQDFDIDESSRKNECILKHYSHNGANAKLKISFNNEENIRAFIALIRYLKKAMKKRAEDRIKKSRKNISSMRMKKEFLLDINSASQLRAANLLRDGSDPYCVVRITKNIIHQTKPIWNNINPVWTISSDSLVLFETTYEDIALYGLTFEIYDQERLLKNKFLGWASLSFEDFVSHYNKRIELDIEANPYFRKKEGKLTIQIREATSDDKKFMEGKREYFNGVALKENNLYPPSLFDYPTTNRIHYTTNLKKVKYDKQGSKLRKISPYPDPSRPRETTWMTENNIEKESLEPSQSWVHVGNGSLGHLFVEIIACDGLKEYGGVLDIDKIDPFVTLVYEDTHVCSEVVYNCGNPRFMPWTRRAFVFNITSNTSVLYIAVHDHNHNSADGKEGRLTVGLNNLYPNVEYLLYYDLNKTSRYYPRDYGGVIKLRISLEWHQHRNPFFNVFQESQRFHVSCDENSKLQNAKFAVMGTPNMNRYSAAIVGSLIEELLDYINYFLDGPESLFYILLWRNSHSLRITHDYTMEIPLRSMIFFSGCILGVEKPNFIPSLVCAAIGCFMLCTLTNERRHESPWFRPQSYMQLLQMFCSGKSPQIRIVPKKEEKEKKQTKEMNIADATQKQRENIGKRFKLYLELSELNQEEFEFEDLSTKEKNRIPNLASYYIWPYQQMLQFINGQIQYLLRVLRWERCFLSFWITSVSFLLAFIFMFVPWYFLYKWVGRLVVWVFLSPMNVILDKMMIKNEALFYNTLESRRKQVRENKERAMKLADFKRFLFGKYTLSMPHTFSPDRFLDRPLRMSSAQPFKQGRSMNASVGTAQHVMGGKIDVDMIPQSSYVSHEIHNILKSNSERRLSYSRTHESLRFEESSHED